MANWPNGQRLRESFLQAGLTDKALIDSMCSRPAGMLETNTILHHFKATPKRLRRRDVDSEPHLHPETGPNVAVSYTRRTKDFIGWGPRCSWTRYACKALILPQR